MLHAYDWEGALKECREVLQRDPDHLGALETMAQALWQGGLYADVITTTTRLLRLNPHEPGYRYTRGMAHLSRGELYRAAEDFRTALGQSRDPRFRADVSSALNAVETWLESASESRPGHRAKLGFLGVHSPASPRTRAH